ncbi:unnamed protein product [Ostreobium quekettii]|uniref:F-box domain-containing protein n=1 Tax=Ostreobium quekettii TaxID=121088 RepID=A0A8S1INX9_9CHLO|nr:unnamed protein product [Ostreobium quekettii]|eukprot:evm.model.scf_1059.2 EVM.evm.TU.scf_1059.2   scf_1059:7438-9554(-)
MGRVRVRVSGDTRKAQKVDVSAETTLQELKEKVVCVLNIGHRIDAQSCRLSLNKRDDLVDSPDSLLKDCGVLNGDLIWVMGLEGVSEAGHTTGSVAGSLLEASHPPPEHSTSALSEEGPARDGRIGAPGALGGDTPTGDTSAAMDVDAVGVGQIVPGIAVEGPQAPRVLASVLRCWTDAFSPVKLLLAVIHSAMVEAGFEPMGEGSETTHGGGLFDASVPGLYSLHYRLSTSSLLPYADENQSAECSQSSPGPQGSALVRCMEIGSYLMVYGYCKEESNTYRSLPLDVAHLVESKEGKLVLHDLEGLWRTFKDTVAIPLVSMVAHFCGRLPRLALLSLPEETKELILKMLTMKDVVSICKVSREFCRLGSTNRLWRALFQQEFGPAGDEEDRQGRALGWKVLFGLKWQLRARHRRLAAESRDPWRHWGHGEHPRRQPAPRFYPEPGLPAWPGMPAGGDVDRLPFLGGARPFLGLGRGRGYPRGFNFDIM